MKSFEIPAVSPLWMDLVHRNEGMRSKYESHIHDYCEIYVNVKGNVSFMADGHIYPIGEGEVFITKPNEYHHCIPQSEGAHEYYCLWLRCDEKDPTWDFFFRRPNGHCNRVILPEEQKELLFSICRALDAEPKESDAAELTFLLLRLARILRKNCRSSLSAEQKLPEKLSAILDYINENLPGIRRSEDIAREFFISRNTMERLFRNHLHISPAVYVEAKRLALARTLLSGEKSIQEICFECGFSDYSHFIAKFRKAFGITPLKHRKQKEASEKR